MEGTIRHVTVAHNNAGSSLIAVNMTFHQVCAGENLISETPVPWLWEKQAVEVPRFLSIMVEDLEHVEAWKQAMKRSAWVTQHFGTADQPDDVRAAIYCGGRRVAKIQVSRRAAVSPCAQPPPAPLPPPPRPAWPCRDVVLSRKFDAAELRSLLSLAAADRHAAGEHTAIVDAFIDAMRTSLSFDEFQHELLEVFRVFWRSGTSLVIPFSYSCLCELSRNFGVEEAPAPYVHSTDSFVRQCAFMGVRVPPAYTAFAALREAATVDGGVVSLLPVFPFADTGSPRTLLFNAAFGTSTTASTQYSIYGNVELATPFRMECAFVRDENPTAAKGGLVVASTKRIGGRGKSVTFQVQAIHNRGCSSKGAVCGASVWVVAVVETRNLVDSILAGRVTVCVNERKLAWPDVRTVHTQRTYKINEYGLGDGGIFRNLPMVFLAHGTCDIIAVATATRTLRAALRQRQTERNGAGVDGVTKAWDRHTLDSWIAARTQGRRAPASDLGEAAAAALGVYDVNHDNALLYEACFEKICRLFAQANEPVAGDAGASEGARARLVPVVAESIRTRAAVLRAVCCEVRKNLHAAITRAVQCLMPTGAPAKRPLAAAAACDDIEVSFPPSVARQCSSDGFSF